MICAMYSPTKEIKKDDEADSEKKLLKRIGSNQSDTPVVDYNIKFIPIFFLFNDK